MNQRGFMLVSVVFLTLIVSFAAMITLQAMTRAENTDTALRLHAINLANEQFAIIESGSSKNIPSDDLKNLGLYYNNQTDRVPIEFKVKTNISGEGNLRKVTVTVTWQDNSLEFEKIIRREN